MMLPLTEIFAFSAFAWIGSFTPGPNVAIAASTGVNHGLRAAMPHVAGVPLGFVGLLWLVGMGGAAILQGQPVLLMAMKLAGNGYLLYLAWKLCFASQLSAGSNLKPLTLMQSILFQLVNPKAWMMLVAAASTYAIGREDYILRLSWMSLGFAVPSALSLFSWAWAGEKLRHWLVVGKRLRIFNFCMGISLACTAAWMVQQ
ncbi:MAG: LysE family translocator [Pseudomonadota bacterium]